MERSSGGGGALSENSKAFLCIRETVSNRSLIVLRLSQFTGVQTFLQLGHFFTETRATLTFFERKSRHFLTRPIIQRWFALADKNDILEEELESFVDKV